MNMVKAAIPALFPRPGTGLLCLGLLATILLRVPYYQHAHTFVDESIYTSTASELVHGEILYRDIWCNHMPLAVYFCKWMFQIFGVNSNAIHIGSLLLALLECLLLCLIGARFFSPRIGGLAAFGYSIISVNFYTARIIGYTPEQLTVVFISSAVFVYLYSIEKNRSGTFFWVGLLSMAAACSKPPAVFEALMFGVLLIFTIRHSKVRGILWLAAGWASGIAVLLLSLQATGSLSDWWAQSVMSRVLYVNQIGLIDWVYAAARQFVGFGLIYLWLWILIWCGRRGITSLGPKGRFLLIWFVAAFMGVALGRRFYANYYIQLFPVLSLLGAIAFDRMLQDGIRIRHKIAVRVAAGLLLAVFCWFQARTLAHWYFFINDAAHQRTELWRMCVTDRNMKRIADQIRSATKPEDRIFVFGPSPEFYFLSGRRMATRYPFFDVHDSSQPPYGDEEKRTLQALSANPPSLIVDHFKSVRLTGRDGWNKLLANHYQLLLDDWEVRLYLRNDRLLDAMVGTAGRPSANAGRPSARIPKLAQRTPFRASLRLLYCAKISRCSLIGSATTRHSISNIIVGRFSASYGFH